MPKYFFNFGFHLNFEIFGFEVGVDLRVDPIEEGGQGRPPLHLMEG